MLSVVWFAEDMTPSVPLLLGHRGTPRLHHENTLVGFEEARRRGLDGVELDVRRAACGTLVVHHDARLPDGRDIARLSFRALAPHPVPTLAEVGAWAAETGVFLNIELKYERARPDDRAARTVDLVRRLGLTKRVIVSSFNPWVLASARAAGPEVPRGLLLEPSTGRSLRLAVFVASRLDAHALHPHFSLVTPDLVRAARTRGWAVNAWTVNDAQEVARLTALGVDGLIGDVPEVLLTARARTPRATDPR